MSVVQGTFGSPYFPCPNCGCMVPTVCDVPHVCRTAGFPTVTSPNTTTWSYTCTGCGQYIYGGSGNPPHVCLGAVAASDGPEECGLCFSLVRRGKMSDHWMNLHHAPQPG